MRGQAKAADKKDPGPEKENDAPVEEGVIEPVEVVDAATSDSAQVDVKKISTELKTVGAIRKTQRAKQREAIETKMISMLTEDKQDDAIDLAFAAISKRAKVKLNDK